MGGASVNHRPRSGVAPPYRQLFGGMPGWCQVCGGCITEASGKPSRRTWHNGRDGEPRCLRQHWFANGDVSVIRAMVLERDGGVCAACPPGSLPCDTPERPEAWQADHIVPLVDGGEHTMANLQTLCHTHHKEKTSREATSRAAARQVPSGQAELWAVAGG